MIYKDLSSEFKYEKKNVRDSVIFKFKHKEKINENIIERKYFVYVYLDPRNEGEFIYGNFKFDYAPFYVGKGVDIIINNERMNYDRHFSHLYYYPNKIVTLKHKVINDIKTQLNRLPIIIKVVENVDEKTSYDVENYLINNIGRINNRTGILTNIVSGHKTEWEKIINK